MATAQTYNPTTATATGYDAKGYDATTAQAADWNVDDKQLVQNQVQGIVAQDSPLMQQAATAAKQGMAQRGLLNSSMAVGAGQNAVIAQALPMAQQDAGTYAQSAQFNANNRTNVNVQNAGFKNDAARYGAEATNRASEFGAAANNQVGMFNADVRNQAGQFNTQQANQFGLVDLQQQNQLAQMAQQQTYNLQTMTQQQRDELARMAAAQGYNLQTMSQQQINQLAQMAQEQQYTQANTQLEYQLDTAQKTALANLSTQSAERLAQIEAQYKNLNQTSQSATSIMNTTMQAIASIMQDSSLDATAKQKAIDIYNANAETSLNLIAALAGDVELDDFFARLGA